MKRLLLIALLLGSIGRAQAHKASDSFLRVTVDAERIAIRWDIALRDLDFAIGLDGDADGAITWGEVLAEEAAIAAYAEGRLKIAGDTRRCALAANPGLAIAEHSDGRYVVLSLDGLCPTAATRFSIDYALLFDIDAQHRGLLNLAFGGSVQTGVFAPDRRQQTFESGRPSGIFRTYFLEGAWHVWKGADHMLFLAGLFLPAVLRRKKGGWEPATSLGTALRDTAALVTAFTLAHALTLALAASGAFSPPSRVVESLVAASVLFAGLNNLLPMVQRRLWLLAGFFGLIHGAAIAGALLELGLPVQGRVTALLAFNIGVELAQLALVAVVVPLCFAGRHSAGFRNAVLVPGTLIVALAGLAWLLQRALGLPITLPF
ncbi:HupE/UreJ family protein [Nevskia sp.]|uniref:HupE/UreJ family protein n=1 Tax=Nevskia sp. TaxID=1929292 RepID=UPI0025F5599B|nr:HupE/UreJ family protein [Nevskia sp.]